MKSLLSEDEVLLRQTRITAEKGHNLWLDSWITLKYLQLFSKPVFRVLPMESLLGEDEVLSYQTGITAEKGHNLWSDSWITLTYLL
jgi:hypothetical protein